MLCLQKMLIFGIPAGRLLLLERCSMCCLGSSHNALTFRRCRWHYISNSYQSLSHGGTIAFSLRDYSLIECLQFINHSTHLLRSVYPKGAVHVRETTHPIPRWRSDRFSKVKNLRADRCKRISRTDPLRPGRPLAGVRGPTLDQTTGPNS